MEIKVEKTEREFFLLTFTDIYGSQCSLQESSLAEERAIWLGVDDPRPEILASQTPEGGNGWVPFPLPDGVHIWTRMHLNQDAVKALLPILQHFAETGELPIESS